MIMKMFVSMRCLVLCLALLVVQFDNFKNGDCSMFYYKWMLKSKSSLKLIGHQHRQAVGLYYYFELLTFDKSGFDLLKCNVVFLRSQFDFEIEIIIACERLGSSRRTEI